MTLAAVLVMETRWKERASEIIHIWSEYLVIKAVCGLWLMETRVILSHLHLRLYRRYFSILVIVPVIVPVIVVEISPRPNNRKS